MTAERHGLELMLHKAIGVANTDTARYVFVSAAHYDTATLITLDSTKDYLIFQINYATANGSTLTTDSVSLTTTASTNTGGTYSHLYRTQIVDNTGDEGTGTFINISSAIKCQSISFTMQAVEDYSATFMIIFEDRGASYQPSVADFNWTLSSGTQNPWSSESIPNTNIGTFLAHASDVTSLRESSRNSWTLTNISDNASGILVFYHGYGGSELSTTTAVLTRQSDITAPVVEQKFIANLGVGNSSSYSLRIFSGNDVYGDSTLILSSDDAFSQGDAIVAFLF